MSEKTLSTEQKLKKQVAEFAVDTYVRDNMTIGLGSGTTAIWAVRYIAKKVAEGSLHNISCGVTGPGTKLDALKEGLHIGDLNDSQLIEFDVVIDGADEFDSSHNLVKGGGGCLLQEKIVGYSAKKFVIIVTKEKQVDTLGISFPLPIEVIPSAYTRVKKHIENSYKVKDIVLRKDARNVGPWITEEGNYLLDIYFAQAYTPAELEDSLIKIVGVVETGMFTKNRPILVFISSDGNIACEE